MRANPEEKFNHHPFLVQTEDTKAVSISQKGVTRSENQDRSLIKTIPGDAVVAAVADGIGGEPAGDVAAEMTIASFEKIQKIRHGSELDVLKNLLKEADRQILKASEQNPSFEDMGTTLTAVVVKGKIAYWAHVGDSRLYLLRKKRLEQITQDQTFARFLLDEGEITQEQVATHYSRHILDQCVGHGECEPETGSVSLRKDDLLLLSTDGLHKVLDSKNIERILSSDTAMEAKTSTLVKKAIETRGNDDITLILLHIL